MKTIISIIGLLLAAFVSYGQDIRFASKLDVQNVVGTDPYVITASVDDCLSQFTSSTIATGDSIYINEGGELVILVVTGTPTVSLGVATFPANDPNNSGIIPTGGGAAIFRPTANYKFPSYVCGLADDLQQMVQSRFVQRLDAAIAAATVADGDKGDITVSGSGGTWNIDASAVTTTEILDGTVALGDLAFTPWYSGNDGTGSGLDADLLDGQSGTFYLDNETASASYNALTGLLTLTQTDGGTVTATAREISVLAAAPVGVPAYPVAVDTVGVDTFYVANNGAWVMFSAGGSTAPALEETVVAAERDTFNASTAAGTKSIDVASILRSVDAGDVWQDSTAARTKQQYFAEKTATIPTTKEIKWDVDTAQAFRVILTSHISLANPENIKAGGRYTLIVKQNNTGGKTINFADAYEISDLSTFSTTANATNIIDFVSDGSKMYGNITSYTATDEFAIMREYWDSLEVAFFPHWAGASSTLSGGGSIIPVTATGQEILGYNDATVNANKFVEVGGSPTPPTLEKVEGRYCYDFDGTTDELTIRGSRYLGAPIDSGIFSIFFWINTDDNGETDYIINSHSGSGNGLRIRKETTDKLTVAAGNGAFSKTTATAVIKADSAWVSVLIRANGSAGQIKIGNQATETFTVTPVTTTTAYQTDFNIMEGEGVYTDGQLGVMFITRNYMSDALYNRLKSYNPQALNFSPISFFRDDNTFTTPAQITGLDMWYDFSDNDYLFENSAGTAPVSVNNDTIWRVENKAPSTYAKQATANSAATVPIYNTNQQNGLAVATFQSTDYLALNLPSLLSAADGDRTFFMVAKATDTTRVNSVLSSSSNDLSLTPTTGTDKISTGHVHAALLPVDSFRINENYVLAGRGNQAAWNIFEFRRRGGLWYGSINRQHFSMSTSSLSTQLTHISTTTSSKAFVGQIGEILIWNNYLDNVKCDSVYSYLSEKWGIIVSSDNLSDDEDVGRITLYDNRGDSENDYNAWPTADLVNDTLHVYWTSGDGHQNSVDTTDALLFGRFDLQGNQIGVPEVVDYDHPTVSENVFHLYASYDLGNDTILFTYVRTLLGGGTNASKFKIRRPNGTYSAETTIVHPGFSTFYVTDQIHKFGAAWYVAGYTTIGGGGNYAISILKSTDRGASWTDVMTLTGLSLGGLDPEEPKLRRLSDGRYYLIYREDVGLKIYSIESTNIDSWTPIPVEIGEGFGMPNFVETNRRILIVSTRGHTDNEALPYLSIYYKSYDMGRTWTAATEYDAYRRQVGWSHEYGSPVDLGNGYVALIWGAEDPSSQIANISMKKIKVR